MIPKKKRRLITVDGAKYEYCITSSVFIRKIGTNETITWHDGDARRGTHESNAITPKDIAELIRMKFLYGRPAMINGEWADYHIKLAELSEIRQQQAEKAKSAKQQFDSAVEAHRELARDPNWKPQPQTVNNP